MTTSRLVNHFENPEKIFSYKIDVFSISPRNV